MVRPVALRRSPLRRQPVWTLPAVIFALKLLAAAVAGAAVTVVLWHGGSNPFGRHASDADSFGTAYYPGRQETRIYRSVPPLDRGSGAIHSEVARGLPANFPRRVKTVAFTPPAGPSRFSGDANVLTGKPLRYLIGASSSGSGHDDEVTVVSYTAAAPVKRGVSIAYCNLFDENNSVAESAEHHAFRTGHVERLQASLLDPAEDLVGVFLGRFALENDNHLKIPSIEDMKKPAGSRRV